MSDHATLSVAKHLVVSEHIRRRIVSGALRPGQRVPNRDELEREFGVSSVTIQTAFDTLRAQGFIRSRSRLGTHVVDCPPHLYRYGVVFPHRPGQGGPWNEFWRVITAEAEALSALLQESFAVYYDRSPHDSSDYDLLLADIQTNRLAGVIFVDSLAGLLGTPVADCPGLPRVQISRGGPTVPCLDLDYESLLHKALRYFVDHGRKRVALLTPPRTHTDIAYFTAAAAKLGLQTQPYWTQYADIAWPTSATHAAHLLMAAPPATRPDALIVGDDNLLHAASLGLAAAQVRVGIDIDVVAHANFPCHTKGLFAVPRLGFGVRELLLVCKHQLDLQRHGQTGPAPRLPARWENEVEPAVTLAMAQAKVQPLRPPGYTAAAS